MSVVEDTLDERIAAAAQRRDARVACAESLSSGAIAARLGAAPEAAKWLRGGLSAYAPEIKHRVLGVRPGPLVTAECATQMARGAAELMSADHVVAVTGVGGPDPEEGEPPGTVWFALLTPAGVSTELARFEGEPEEVVRQTVERALTLLAEALTDSKEPPAP